MNVLAPIERWPVDHVAAAALLPTGELVCSGDIDATFDLASITKPLAACATLVAIEDGTLDLDRPCGPEGSTVRHLLSHASGLDFESDQILAKPGTRRIYSNTGYELIRQLLETETGIEFPTYVAEAILDPLEMRSTTMSTSAAAGATGTVADLVQFVADLMNEHPTILAAATRDQATTPAFPGIPGVLPGFGSQDANEWGLGFEIRGTKQPHWAPDGASPRTFGHFGRSGSLIWIDPEVGAGLVVLGDRAFGDWAPPLWRELGQRVISAARP